MSHESFSGVEGVARSGMLLTEMRSGPTICLSFPSAASRVARSLSGSVAINIVLVSGG